MAVEMACREAVSGIGNLLPKGIRLVYKPLYNRKYCTIIKTLNLMCLQRNAGFHLSQGTFDGLAYDYFLANCRILDECNIYIHTCSSHTPSDASGNLIKWCECCNPRTKISRGS